MTLVSQIISDAYRETNLIAVEKAPSPAQAAEGLRLFQRQMAAIYGNDAGENLNDWPLGNYGRNIQFDIPSTQNLIYPEINSQILALAETPLTVYLPVEPSNGSRIGLIDPFSRLLIAPVTLDANGRTIEGAETLLCNVAGTRSVWFYRADLGNWVKLTDLVETDEMPFPIQFDDYFTIMLAARLNPRYGKTLPADTKAMLKRAQQDFSNTYLQSASLSQNIDLSFNSMQSFNTGRGYGSTNSFNRGNWGR
jgi:hypothetical protein